MQKPAEQINTILRSNQNTIAEKTAEMQYANHPEFWGQYGEEGKKLCIRDTAYHLSFLAEALELEDPDIFADYVEWVKHLFLSLGFPDEAMINNLKYLQEVVKEFMPADLHHVVSEYLELGIRKMHEPIKAMESFIDETQPLGKLAKAFNQTLLEGNRYQASRMIMDAVKKGTPIDEIYLQVFQQSQLEVGRLWMENKITVAKEHFVSAATQMIMSQLYPYIFATERKGHNFIAASVGGELHEIGIRMVSDFFEMDGWDTYYLGSNTPTYTLLQAIKEHQADILGLSITMPYHRSMLNEVVNNIKSDETGKNLIILIGGNGLKGKGHLWKSIGADGYAPDAREAIKLANQLIRN